MRFAYIDMVGGVAGDMLLAAFLDAGLDRVALERALRTIVRDGWEFAPQRVDRRGIAATYAGLIVAGEDGDPEHDVDRHHHGSRTLRDVLEILERSELTARQRERAGAVYRRLAQAEATVHGTTADAIHFHECGQLDAVLDVAATCVALDLLEIDELRCSSFPAGTGTIRMHHGRYPNPGPATTELLRGFAVRQLEVEAELTTPTGAAIVTALATPGPYPEMTLERAGYGAGRNDFAIPNVTRVLIGTTAHVRTGEGTDDVAVLEANIDDMSPQHYELALERLFAAGARDVWLTPVTMKKGRPAIVLAALCAPSEEAAVAGAMLRETTTIGVRVRHERRYTAPREISLCDTPLGAVRVKRITIDGVVRRRPEYDDLLRIARERGLPLAEVATAVEAALASVHV